MYMHLVVSEYVHILWRWHVIHGTLSGQWTFLHQDNSPLYRYIGPCEKFTWLVVVLGSISLTLIYDTSPRPIVHKWCIVATMRFSEKYHITVRSCNVFSGNKIDINKVAHQIHNVIMCVTLSRNNNRLNDVWSTSLKATRRTIDACILPISWPLHDLYCDVCIWFLPLSSKGSLKIRKGNNTMHFPPLWNAFWLIERLKVRIVVPFVDLSLPSGVRKSAMGERWILQREPDAKVLWNQNTSHFVELRWVQLVTTGISFNTS